MAASVKVEDGDQKPVDHGGVMAILGHVSPEFQVMRRAADS
jgi:hypothetical protein